MKKPLTLQQELANANKLKAAQEAKIKAIELKLQKEADKAKVKEPKPIYETVTTLPQVYKHLKVDPKKDIIKVDGFDKEELKVVESIVKRMRVCKVYNEGKVPTKKDYRYYPWHYIKSSGSGLAFYSSVYGDDHAHSSSAARLSFFQKLSSDSYAKNFMDVEEGIIGL